MFPTSAIATIFRLRTKYRHLCVRMHVARYVASMIHASMQIHGGRTALTDGDGRKHWRSHLDEYLGRFPGFSYPAPFPLPIRSSHMHFFVYTLFTLHCKENEIALTKMDYLILKLKCNRMRSSFVTFISNNRKAECDNNLYYLIFYQ